MSPAQRGLTLIEMAVVVAITAILALMALQLGAHWTNSAKVSRAQAALQHAFSAAKSAALQNNLAVTGDEVSASVCIRDGRISAVLGVACESVAVWSTTQESSVAVTLGSGEGATCVALTSAGLPVEASGCTTETTYSLQAGSVHVENKNLY